MGQQRVTKGLVLRGNRHLMEETEQTKKTLLIRLHICDGMN